MEANNETNIVEDKEIHPDVLYATMLAINICRNTYTRR